ncbi:hypothetical protein [Kocuria sabuli]|uniref:hypothetical protein n=1 Tax=Kocuria sabuli TaxID=3071448 RepID=UPI0034D7309B
MTAVLTALALLPAMVPNPIDEGTLRPGLDPSQVTPGMAGFLMSLVLAVAVILLVLDFNRRNRRMRYRAEYAERRAAEEHVGGYAPGAQDDRGDQASPGAHDGPGAPAEDPEGPDRRG